MIYKVEKGIPLVRASTYSFKNNPYPFSEMEVTDSFLIKTNKDTVRTIRHRLYGFLRAYRYYNPKLITFKIKTKFIEGEGLRVWRKN